ncbi:MAG: histidine--tRNA ligase [Planctomycetota bacterium]|jgi:histidyl-tRNA synthetase
MAAGGHKYQAPKGTRDFYPPEMAVRRHLERLWREVSVRHGFDEVDGPTYEHLELYTVKSGEGIVSELFSFRRSGGETDYALRPEFTPSLARMVAARGSQLPKPIRWFSMPSMFRAERPQRGRLREHIQWNLDILGDETPRADADLIALAADFLAEAGLTPDDVRIRISHRDVVSRLFDSVGVNDANRDGAFALLDRRDKTSEEEFQKQAAELGLDAAAVERLNTLARTNCPATTDMDALASMLDLDAADLESLGALRAELDAVDVLGWCQWDLGIVRGLAYYTGVVFEVHEAAGKERAIAGGGRYDELVELFNGPPTSAVGFAMGDVVIRLVLEDRGLLDAADSYLPRPDAFVISAGDDLAESALRPLVARLRRAGLHVRTTGRATRNVGKLLGEAGKARARLAVILGSELADGQVQVKDLDGGDQQTIAIDDLESHLRAEH